MTSRAAELPPGFEPVQATDFGIPEGQAVAWADIEGDGDLDLAIGFRRKPLKLFRNDDGHFVDIASTAGIETGNLDTRSLSWGDVDGDGQPDLFVGFGRGSTAGNRLYRNDGTRFTDTAASVGLAMPDVAAGSTRQASWIDVDGDGDTDLFVAVRWGVNRLFRNDNGRFVDISAESGLADPRRTVGAAWFDMDEDGDLDLFIANQSGDRDGVYRNDGGRFVDVAADLGMDRPGRDIVDGSVGVSVCDFDNDGHFDMYVPSYGDDILYLGDGKGGFRGASRAWGVDAAAKSVASDCGDYDNDGHVDLYVAAYAIGETFGYDRLYRNSGTRFSNVLFENHEMPDADHGVRWADYDADGDLDLALTNRNAGAALMRNTLGVSPSSRSLSLRLVNEEGHHVFQGAEIRAFESDSETLLGSRLIDTGGGYVAQDLAPVHIGLGEASRVDIVVTWPNGRSRHAQRFDGIDVAAESTEPITLTLPSEQHAVAGRTLEISRSDYLNRLQGFWLGQSIANWTGLVTEMDKTGGEGPAGRFYTREDWGKPDQPNIWSQERSPWSPTIDWVYESPDGIWGADDDTDIEYIYQHLLLTHETSVLTAEQIRDGWLTHIYPDSETPFRTRDGRPENYLWVSNQRAYDLMSERGLVPPATSDPDNNPDFDMIDAQLTTEIFGLFSPARPDVALRMAHLPIRTTAQGEAALAAEFYVIMHSLSSAADSSLALKEQVQWLAAEARKHLPDDSYTAKMYDFVKSRYEAGVPWEQARDEVYLRYQVEQADGYDITSRNMICNGCFAAGINFAASIVSLLYGEGDFRETVKIAVLAGWDSDNPAATWGGLLGFMNGKAAIESMFGHQFSNRFNIHRTRRNFPVAGGIDDFESMAGNGAIVIDRVVVEEMGGTYDARSGTWHVPVSGETMGSAGIR